MRRRILAVGIVILTLLCAFLGYKYYVSINLPTNRILDEGKRFDETISPVRPSVLKDIDKSFNNNSSKFTDILSSSENVSKFADVSSISNNQTSFTYSNVFYIDENNDNNSNISFDNFSGNEENIIDTYSDKNTDSSDEKSFLSDVKELNGESVGWIYIPETRIDYPVMQSRDNEFRLIRHLE